MQSFYISKLAQFMMDLLECDNFYKHPQIPYKSYVSKMLPLYTTCKDHHGLQVTLPKYMTFEIIIAWEMNEIIAIWVVETSECIRIMTFS